MAGSALSAGDREFLAAVRERFPDKMSRLRGGFYDIKDKAGNKTPFRMNADQEEFIVNRWLLDIVLKSRQKGFCLSGETRILTEDLRWVPIADMQPGMRVVAVDEYPHAGRGKSRLMRTADVIACVEVRRPAYRLTLEDGRSIVCTDKHPWLTKKAATDTDWRSLAGPKKIRVGTKIRAITTPWDEGDFEDGWFGGMIDGEGSFRSNPPRLTVTQRPTKVWDRLVQYCTDRAYSGYHSIDPGNRPSCYGRSPVHRIEFGRMDEIFRILGQTRPTRFVGSHFWEGCVLPGKRSDAKVWFAVTDIEYVGEQVLYDLQTSTGTYIAEGLVSHNTTVIQLDMLDDCLFIPNTSAGVIAHNLQDAKAFFRDKIKFAYDNLPTTFRKVLGAENDSAESLRFTNGSSIRVGTSLRSGTLQILHVSEFGKLCAKYPERAEEVKTGAFNTVHPGQRITVESTAEGRAGEYKEMCDKAQRLQQEGKELTLLDFKFHFSGWWSDASCVLSDEDVARVTVSAEMSAYFDGLEQHPILAAKGVKLSPNQRAWYVKKAEQQGDKMKQEFPSTPEEAFEASVEGAYFGPQMLKMRADGRICRIPILGIPVYTTWDLGVGDAMTICFWQDVGLERRMIDYYENSGEGFEHYAKVLSDKGYNYSEHYMPHDADHRRLGRDAKSAKQHAEECGIKPVTVVPRIPVESYGIDATRAFLPTVYIDQERCQRAIDCLDSYRKEWDDKLAVWKDKAVHDQFSHGYKAIETAAVRKPKVERPLNTNLRVPTAAGGFRR